MWCGRRSRRAAKMWWTTIQRHYWSELSRGTAARRTGTPWGRGRLVKRDLHSNRNCIFCPLSQTYQHCKRNTDYLACSGGTRFFVGASRGKMRFWGGKYPKICQKLLILAIFFFWRGEEVGRASNGGGGKSPWRRHCYLVLSKLSAKPNRGIKYLLGQEVLQLNSTLFVSIS